MIHFNFTVTDEDAENIFDCINSAVRQCCKRKLSSGTTQAESDWLDKHIDYLDSLKEKMANERVV
jgi:hypothetical protein